MASGTVPAARSSVQAPHRAFAWFLVATVVTVALFALGDTVRGRVCRDAATDGPCGVAAMVAPADAVGEVTSFVAHLTSGDASTAWQLLGPAGREGLRRDEFVGLWDDALWAEPVGTVERTGASRYTVTVRAYRQTAERHRADGSVAGVEGRVVEQPLTIDLRQTDAGARIAGIDVPVGRSDDAALFPRVALQRMADLHARPATGSDVTVRGRKVGLGGEVTALCQVNAATGGAAPDFWTRTPQGWISNTAFGGARQALDGMLWCDAGQVTGAAARS